MNMDQDSNPFKKRRFLPSSNSDESTNNVNGKINFGDKNFASKNKFGSNNNFNNRKKFDGKRSLDNKNKLGNKNRFDNRNTFGSSNRFDKNKFGNNSRFDNNKNVNNKWNKKPVTENENGNKFKKQFNSSESNSSPSVNPLNKTKNKDAAPDCMPLTRKAPPPMHKKLLKIDPNERKIRDPRFDDLSGKLDQAAWNKNYKFIEDMKKHEQETLLKEFEETEDEEHKKKIKLTLQRINNQTREKNKNTKQIEVKKQQRKNTIESLNQGKKPYYKKNSEIKLEMMAQQFQTLKKENRLDKYLERKEKHKMTKELFGK